MQAIHLEPNEAIKLGETVDYEDKTLTADQLFIHGKDAKQSGLGYFMTTKRGIIGFEE